MATPAPGEMPWRRCSQGMRTWSSPWTADAGSSKTPAFFARDGVIEQVGLAAELPATADRTLDLRGHILLPGLINCHHHLDQVLTRNLPAGQNTNLFPWLRAHYRIWAARTPEDTRTAVIVGCAELALFGCTTDFDHTYVCQNGCQVDDQIHAAADIG